jgi:diguanylate cyclase (GGDEF)-like protein
MKIAKLPEDEKDRLEALRNLRILDTPMEKSFEKITRLVQKLFEMPIVNITLVDEHRQWFKSTQGLNITETSREVAFCSHAILEDDVMVINDAREDERFRDNPLVTGNPNIRFYAGCPVRERTNYKVGTLCMIDSKPRTLTQSDLNCFLDFGGLVENELQNYQLLSENQFLSHEIQRIKKPTAIDKLTRLWNRNGLEEILKHVHDHSAAKEKVFLVALADVDHFKLINDTYGPSVGDGVLSEIAKILIGSSRNMDAVGRWEGEKFVIIIYGQEPKVMYKVLARIKDNVERADIKSKNNVIRCTMTIGAAIFNPHYPKTVDELMVEADKNLYKGKQSGRNKIVFD